jgi:hypothetical protein
LLPENTQLNTQLRMNTQTIFRAMAAIALILAVNFSANAQLNLNKLKDKATEATKGKATETVGNATGQSASQGAQAQAPPKNLKPSAAAIAADPKASDNAKPEEDWGFTRTRAQIRAGYEALNPKVYLQPYYHPNLQEWYWLENENEDKIFTTASSMLDEDYRVMRKNSFYYDGKIEFYGSNSAKRPCSKWIGVTIPPIDSRDIFKETSGYLPIGIHVMLGGFALFSADPEGYIPFMKFCEARLAYDALDWVGINPDGMTWDNVTVNIGGKSEKMPLKWDDLRTGSHIRAELDRLEAIAKTIPVPVITSAAAYYINNVIKFEEAKIFSTTRWYFHFFEVAMYYLTNHPKGKSAENYEQLWSLYRQYQAEYKDWVKAEDEKRIANAPPIEMPKTYNMDATTTSKVLAAAKKQFTNFTVEKVVFLWDGWRELKDPKYPYAIIMRKTDVGLLTKVDDKWQILLYDLVQRKNNSGGWHDVYEFVAPMGDSTEPRNVNYK